MFNWGSAGEVAEGVGNGISSIAGSLRHAITGDLPPEQKIQLQEILLETEKLEHGLKSQMMDIVKVDANSSSKFQSWWRPAIGWVAGLSLASYFLPQHLIGAYVWIMHVTALTHEQIIEKGFPAYPVSPDAMMELVIALLGMGMIRSVDKFNKVAK